MAVAPANRNSIASCALVIPPSPMMGIFTALAVCHTMRSAMGFTHGPERPPVTVESMGRRCSASMAIPNRVLMRDTESAPSASAARAISVMSVTFGESFTMSVRGYMFRTACTTSAALLGHVPNAIPPCFTLGQDMFSSIAGILSRGAICSAHAT